MTVTLPWCQDCQATVEAHGGCCPHCGSPVFSTGHQTDCKRRPPHSDPPSAEEAPLSTDPMVRPCAGCGVRTRMRPRNDRPHRPRSHCTPCGKKIASLWRQKNWQRKKARDTWKGMVARCHNNGHGKNCPPGIPRYRDYGGKGVRVCRRWRDSFEAFVEDVGLPPTKESTLDRKNPNRNYTPSNCQWVDPKTQAENRKNTHWISAHDPDGQLVKKTISDWARTTGVNRHTIRRRLQRGWSADDAVLLAPLRPGQTHRTVQEEVPF